MSEHKYIGRRIASNPFSSGVFASVRADIVVLMGEVCPSVCLKVPLA